MSASPKLSCPLISCWIRLIRSTSRKSEGSALAFYSSCNKVLQTYWLKRAHMYYLTVLEVIIPKQCQWVKNQVLWAGLFPPVGSRKESIPLPFQLLEPPVFLGLQPLPPSSTQQQTIFPYPWPLLQSQISSLSDFDPCDYTGSTQRSRIALPSQDP